MLTPQLTTALLMLKLKQALRNGVREVAGDFLQLTRQRLQLSLIFKLFENLLYKHLLTESSRNFTDTTESTKAFVRIST